MFCRLVRQVTRNSYRLPLIVESASETGPRPVLNSAKSWVLDDIALGRVAHVRCCRNLERALGDAIMPDVFHAANKEG